MLPKSLQPLVQDPRVDEIRDERATGDGYAVYLKHGWRMPEMIAAVRGYTVREVLNTSKAIERGCTTSPCTQHQES
jgi:hypothetical protein